MRALIPLFVSLFLAGPAFADRLSLSDISAYLNEITTAEAAFTQMNSNGSVSTGRLLIRRPGRMRFEYDPPDSALVVAGSNTLVIVDKKSNAPPETYPLRRTPLWVLLERNVDLGRADMVVGHTFDGSATTVVAQDPENPEYGQIDLVFQHDPIRLREWVVHDGSGTSTKVILGALARDMTLPNRLFDTSREGIARD